MGGGVSMRSITIGSEFFAKAKNDYASYYWAIIREFFQNSIDSGASHIDVKVYEDDQGRTVLVVANNGNVMTEEILINKLLSLGGSGKNFTNGATGGFGKAKEILYFCHEKYSIESGELSVSGSGATYELEILQTPFKGTRSTILMDERCADSLLKNIHRFISFAEWSGKFTINGEEFRASMRKGQPKRDMGFCTVYINKSPANELVVRMNGIPMFINHTEYKRCVILELKGASSEVLASNRDCLLWKHQSKLNSFITELTVNGSAVDSKAPVYSRYPGYRLSTETQSANKMSVSEVISIIRDSVPASGIISELDWNPTQEAQTTPTYAALTNAKRTPHKISPLGHEFIIKNELGLKIPAHYCPGEFSTYSTKLVKMWCRVLLQLHKIFQIESSFSVGFIFGDHEAMFESNEIYGAVYYLNPCQIVKQNNSVSRSLKRRFKLTERDRILAIAVHEFVHGLGNKYHNEEYACILTDTFAKVMQYRNSFNWCFK
jgi:hypothetical protein